MATHTISEIVTPNGDVCELKAHIAEQLETGRIITIGRKGFYFDGSRDISYSLSEIGAVDTNDIATLAEAKSYLGIS